MLPRENIHFESWNSKFKVSQKMLKNRYLSLNYRYITVRNPMIKKKNSQLYLSKGWFGSLNKCFIGFGKLIFLAYITHDSEGQNEPT